jgi:FKBP-type peptidyl-prolyl cis-trans isomerase (trigger factor)
VPVRVRPRAPASRPPDLFNPKTRPWPSSRNPRKARTPHHADAAGHDINNEVESRLKKLARTVKADGFRPGKVPMSVVAQRYGYSVQYEVVNDRGRPGLQPRPPPRPSCAWPARRASRRRTSAPEGQLAFDATFEVYPEVKIGDLSPPRSSASAPR